MVGLVKVVLALIMDLMDEAENACMAHHALRNPIPWSSRLIYNGQEVLNRNG